MICFLKLSASNTRRFDPHPHPSCKHRAVRGIIFSILPEALRIEPTSTVDAPHSDSLVVTTFSPSRENDADHTVSLWPLSVCSHSPVTVLHMHTVLRTRCLAVRSHQSPAGTPNASGTSKKYFFDQQAAPITLTAGERYYIRATANEGGGGDNLCVGIQEWGADPIRVNNEDGTVNLYVP